MIKLRLYAHLVNKADESIEMGFKAIDVVQRIADYLANLYNGRTDCSSCDTVQYSDTLYLDVSDACIESILRDYPFIHKPHKQ